MVERISSSWCKRLWFQTIGNSSKTFYKKVTIFCSKNGIDTLSANESSSLLYLSLLFSKGKVSSMSNCISAVKNAHTHVPRSLSLTPLVKLAAYVYLKNDRDRLSLIYFDQTMRPRALPSPMAWNIFAAAFIAPYSNLEFLRNSSEMLLSYGFWELEEAVLSLQLSNITDSQDRINIEIALRKNQPRVAQTLSYASDSKSNSSVIYLVICYDKIRRNNFSGSKYY